MPAPDSYDYAVLRFVPRVEREEFINVGVAFHCFARDFLEVSTHVDETRALALAPAFELARLRNHLCAVAKLCTSHDIADALRVMGPKERFAFIVAPRSTILQPGPVHSGMTDDPARTLEHLLTTLVR